MNFTKIKSFAALVVLLPLLYACPKPKIVPPEPDTELQSSVDAVFATFLVSDIEMVCSYIAENNFVPDFYIPQPGEDASKFQAFHPTGTDYLVASFNNVTCLDGRVREGSIYLDYTNPDPNAKYYQNYGFNGNIRLNNYRVDGWLIKTVAGASCTVHNQLITPIFDPKQTKLSWTIEGSFEFTHPSDPSKNMLWTGKLTKTLVNTSDPLVYKASRAIPIDWTKADVEYQGKATGFTANEVPFTFAINDFFPMKRDFTCYPTEVGGIETTQPLKVWKNEFHPFKAGVVDFTTDGKYQRVIYLGNEGNSGSVAQCDNSGIVLIKGNSYAVNFKE